MSDQDYVVIEEDHFFEGKQSKKMDSYLFHLFSGLLRFASGQFKGDGRIWETLSFGPFYPRIFLIQTDESNFIKLLFWCWSKILKWVNEVRKKLMVEGIKQAPLVPCSCCYTCVINNHHLKLLPLVPGRKLQVSHNIDWKKQLPICCRVTIKNKIEFPLCTEWF